MQKKFMLGWLVGAMFSIAACNTTSEITTGEASEALAQSSVSSQACALAQASAELSTSFTLGQGAEHAAADVRNFVQSQLPCAEVTLTDATLTIQYGAHPGMCTFHGHSFSGMQTITISHAESSNIFVQHTWDNFSNGNISITGSATVMWDTSSPLRNIQHHITWTRLSDGKTGTGNSDITQTPLNGDITMGFESDGTHTWTSTGTWTLSVNAVQMRWVDPIPQSGSYLLMTPHGKEITLMFERTNATTIKATIVAGTHEFSYNVTEL